MSGKIIFFFLTGSPDVSEEELVEKTPEKDTNPFGDMNIDEIPMDIVDDSTKEAFDDETLDKEPLIEVGNAPARTDYFNPLSNDARRESGKRLGFPIGRRPLDLEYAGVGNKLNGEPEIYYEAGKDGACYFRCISYEISGSEIYHTFVRHVVCNYIADELNSDKMLPYIPWVYKDVNVNGVMQKQLTRQSGKDYIESTGMRQYSKWATEVEIYATAQITGLDVVVYTNHKKWQRYVGSGRSTIITHSAFYLYNPRNVHYDPVTRVE